MVEGSVTTTVVHVTQTFRANNRKDPRLDQDGKTSFMLQEQFKGYRNLDGAKQKQKALPMSVIRKKLEVAITDLDLKIARLLTGALFFAMRSCEYLETGREEVSKDKNNKIEEYNIEKRRNNHWS